MRLLHHNDTREFSFTKDLVGDDQIPPYAILSHTWGLDIDEVTFEDMIKGTGRHKAGYKKIRFCGEQAKEDGLQYFWIDTCCINKANYTELSQAINSMFRWYHNSTRCYVYLPDVSSPVFDTIKDANLRQWELDFQKSRWFERGWTLQELLAPSSVEFFSRERRRLGDKRSLRQQIHEITGIATLALQGAHLSQFSIDERLSWIDRRQTKLEEDKAYSLLGIFDVSMPLIYGEGRKKSLKRLQEEIDKDLMSSSDRPSCDGQCAMKYENIIAKGNTPEINGNVYGGLHFHQSDGIANLLIAKDSTVDSHADQHESGTWLDKSIRHRHYQVYASKLEQNLPPQVLLSDPVILCDALDDYFVFHVEWISSLEIFKLVIEGKTREALENKYKVKGSAKIRNGEFFLQDLERKRNFNLEQPWKSIMRPGTKRYMSIIFRETGTEQQSCPHCGADNETTKGQATTCEDCGATYERIIELEDADIDPKNGGEPNLSRQKLPRKGRKKTSAPEPDLRLAFRRLTLTSKIQRQIQSPIDKLRKHQPARYKDPYNPLEPTQSPSGFQSFRGRFHPRGRGSYRGRGHFQNLHWNALGAGQGAAAKISRQISLDNREQKLDAAIQRRPREGQTAEDIAQAPND